MSIKKITNTQRLEINRRLIEILSRLVENNPDQRFGQLLRNNMFVKEIRPANPTTTHIDWENEFYLESKDLLKRVYGHLAKDRE